MSRKIIIAGIILVVVIIIAVSITLVVINLDKNSMPNININNSQEQNNSLDETNVNSELSAQNLIQEYYTNMKNQDFTSAVELFDKEEFDNITGETELNIIGDRLQLFLQEAYNDSKGFYSYSMNDIRLLNGIEDFRNSTNVDITQKEYENLFGNNKLYIGTVEANGETGIDVFIITTNNKIAGSVRLINYYNNIRNTNDILEDATESKNNNKINSIKESLMLAVSMISTENLDTDRTFKESCTKEKLQEEISEKYIIEEFNWDGEVGKGTIRVVDDNDIKNYNFILTLSDDSKSATVSVNNYEIQDSVKVLDDYKIENSTIIMEAD